MRAIVHRIAGTAQPLHEPLLDIAGQYPVQANVKHHIVGRHFLTSTYMSVLGEKDRHVGPDFSLKNILKGCRERRDGSDYPMKAQK
jgi:hypothetical protein